jgi:hypothetical protein
MQHRLNRSLGRMGLRPDIDRITTVGIAVKLGESGKF